MAQYAARNEGELITGERSRYREILAITRAIAGAQNYGDILRLVVQETAAFTGATACMLILAQEDGLARVVSSVGLAAARTAAVAITLNERMEGELRRVLGFHSSDRFVCVPVIGGQAMLGMLAVYWEGARALEGSGDDELLSAVADQAAIALDNVERLRRLQVSVETLRTSKERFRTLAETTSDWLWEIDENAVYTYASPLVRQLLGYEPEEVLGRTPFDLMPPEEAQRLAEPFAAIAAERKPFSSLENTNRHRDGHLVVLETSGVPLFDGSGKFRGYRGVDRDITQRKSVEQALRASEAKLAGIISIAADAIVSVDGSQRIVMFNHGAEKIFGWSQGEVLGQPLDLLIPERFRRFHHQHVANFNSGSDIGIKIEQDRRSIVGLRKSGEEFPADAAVSRLHDGTGKWINTIVLRDISEQKRREYEELFLAAVGTVLAETLDYESTLTSVAQLAMGEHADFCFVDLVDELGELRPVKAMGSDPAKVALYEGLGPFPLDARRPHLGWTIIQSKQPQLLAEMSPDAVRGLAQSEKHLGLLEALAPTSMMGVPLAAHGRLLGALVVGSCRPEQRYRDTDLRLLAELGRRAALSLDNARLFRTTQRAVRTRDEVLGVVAHDLRNPLGTIVLQATLLQRLEAELGPRVRKLGDSIESAARRMNRLIQDLLDTALMESGSLPIEPERVAPAQIVLRSEESHKALVASGSLQLRVELPRELPDIWGDRDRLFQVFENLLGNAAKFTPAGGDITLGARAAGEGEIDFWVADTGEGISAANMPRLFDRFWQARKGERRGAGLGLCIAKGIVEAHGGRIWAESAPGRGSTFHFTVPVAPPARE
jgi:PAS domain S-box-containing protein